MSLAKGDLVLISDGENTSSCIILTSMFAGSYDTDMYYTYCIESGHYGVVYQSEIISVVCKDFAPNFEVENDFFNTDYYYYQQMIELFSYYPDFFPSGSLDPD